MPVVNVHIVLGTLGTSEGLSWGFRSLLDNVYFRTVNSVMRSRSSHYRTVDFSSLVSGKHSFALINALSFVDRVVPIHERRSSSANAIRVSVYGTLCCEIVRLCCVERSCLVLCAPPSLPAGSDEARLFFVIAGGCTLQHIVLHSRSVDSLGPCAGIILSLLRGYLPHSVKVHFENDLLSCWGDSPARVVVLCELLSWQWLLFGRAFSSDESGDGPGAHDVDPEIADELLELLAQHQASPLDLDNRTILWLNAEGKASTDDQLRVLIATASTNLCPKWLALIILEADFTDAEGQTEHSIDGHRIWRCSVEGGRAQKIILNRRDQSCFRDVQWSGRSCRLDLAFCGADQCSKLSVIGTHMAHGDGWLASCEECLALAAAKPAGSNILLGGDFNLEFRPGFQSRADSEHCHILRSAVHGLGLSDAFTINSTMESRRPSGLAGLMSSPSLLDFAFAPRRFESGGDLSWDGAPGDHAWVKVSFRTHIPKQSPHKRRGKWHCTDWDAYAAYVSEHSPADFTHVSTYKQFMHEAMSLFTDRRSAKQRRLEWEPRRLKELRRQARIELDVNRQEELRKKIFKLRVHIAKFRRQSELASDMKHNRSKPQKAKKLFPVVGMTLDGRRSIEPSEWANCLQDEFLARWKQTKHDDMLLFQELGGYTEGAVPVSVEDIQQALSESKKPLQIDIDGVCLRALAPPTLHPSLAHLISDLAASDDQWQDMRVRGSIKAKRRGTIDASETRGILPQTSLLCLFNRVIFNKMKATLDQYSETHGVRELVLGAGKGSQTRDMVFSLNHALELGRDRHNQCGVALGDIKACHDCIPWGYTLQGLRTRGIPLFVATAFYRAHRCPEIEFNVGGVSFNISNRSRGGLTGSQTAGTMARIAIEDTLISSLPLFQNCFELSQTHTFPAIAWSDNISTVAPTFEAAIQNLQIWEDSLDRLANMQIKQSSKVALASSGRRFQERRVVVGGERWAVRDEENALGCVVSGTGSESSARNAIQNSWNRTFWANAKALCNPSAPQPRLRFWRRICYGAVDHAFASLRPCKHTGAQLDKWNNKFVGRILKLHKRTDEAVNAFVIRKNAQIAREKLSAKLDVKSRWCLKCVTWVEHMKRHPTSISAQLLMCQDDTWLQQQRISAGSLSIFAGITNTRSQPGFPKRWGEGWIAFVGEREGWENPAKDKQLSATRADLLNSYFVRQAQQRLALVDG